MAVTDGAFIEPYAVFGVFSGGILRDMVRCLDWKPRIAMDSHILFWGRGVLMHGVCGDICRLAYECVNQVHGEQLIRSIYDIYVSHYRSYGEVAYGNALSEFWEPEFRGPTPRVERDLHLCSHPVIGAEFCYPNCSQTQHRFNQTD